MSLPRIHEVGRLYKEVELRYTSSGKAVASIPIVFNKRKKNEAGEWVEAGALFVKGTAWEKLGEHCAESLSKGDEIVVSGELSMREYDRSDGTKGQSLELRVDEIGPSLRWNIAKVARATRSGADDSGGHGSSGTSATDDPWTTAPASAKAAGGYDSEPPW